MSKLIIIPLIILILTITVSAECDVPIESQNTEAFLSDIPNINTALQSCPQELPSIFGWLFKNKNIQLDITREDQTTDTLTIAIEEKTISKIIKQSTSPAYTLTVAECNFDSLLGNENRVGAAAFLYKEKFLKIEGNSAGKKVLLFFLKPILRFASGKIQIPMIVECM